MPKHVLILGCGRSGTSIFGELFEHLSGYQYYSEPDFEDVMKMDFNVPIAIKVPRESKNYPAPKGLSFPLADLLSKGTFQIYWQVRHPLDTICSLRVGIANNWGHHPQPHDFKDWLSKPLIEQCAYHWDYINRYGYQQVKAMSKVKRFEEMLNDPGSFANEICSEIGIDPLVNVQEVNFWAGRVQNSNNEKFVEAKTSRAYSTNDHSVKINRWKENLSSAEIESAIPIVLETANIFGYNLN